MTLCSFGETYPVHVNDIPRLPTNHHRFFQNIDHVCGRSFEVDKYRVISRDIE